jgi:dinuclear metal center YbgI/SA1388 family protein
MQIREVTTLLEQIAPTGLQEDYDNAGYIVGNPADEVQGVLCCLDSTEAVLDEAIQKGCNLIVAHHPIIFRGLKSITGQNYVERVILKAIRHNLTIYAIHTNLDNVLANGVNMKIAEKLGLEPLKILRTKNDGHLENGKAEIGAGLICQLPEPQGELEFLGQIKKALNCGVIKYTPLLNKPVEKVAVCGGSGQFLLQDAILSGADVFVTSDFKYHDYFDADHKIVVADVGHYESEQFTAELLYGIITEKFSTFAAYISETITNPIKYLV